MKKLITLFLSCCLVMAMSTPAMAGDYYLYKDVSADDLTNALVDYCNGNTVRNMTEYEFELSNHYFMTYNVVRTKKSLDFWFNCEGFYCMFPPPLPIPPLPLRYSFVGNMHVNNPQDGLLRPYSIEITNHDEVFTANGINWRLDVRNTRLARFKL